MSKQTALWLMLGGAAVSLWELASPGAVYGTDKPLASMRWKVHTTADGKNYYVSISDAVAVAGAYFYFR